MPSSSPDFLATAGPWIGWLCALVAGMNVVATGRALRRRMPAWAGSWLAVAMGFGWLAYRGWMGLPCGFSAAVKAGIDGVLGPVTLSVGWFVVWGGFFLGRRWLVRPAVAWLALNASLAFLALSLADANFAATVTRPDNLPIVAMVYLVGFFTWLATAQAVENDRRMAAGQGPVESDYADTVLVWPDVVYLELIGAVVLTVGLIVWSLLVRAPLEQPANPALTPNPSKAPWYFLGLQEMLVYFAPWMAGVMIPLLIILGLMAIPYLDVNPRGSGYYTIRQRPWAWALFQFGFLQLWVLLILIGTFMRGPDWNFYGLYESQQEHKALVLHNVSLAEYVWVLMLGKSLPQNILLREMFGLIAVGLYYVALPIGLTRTLFRKLRTELGGGRYWIMLLLLLTMLLLPIKMILHWTLHLNYLVNVPEWFFYF